MNFLNIYVFIRSSEIGYAGSPPRAQLARGSSLDSTDKPFHPSEWVDVNLEVSNTIDNNYPTTTTTSCECINIKIRFIKKIY